MSGLSPDPAWPHTCDQACGCPAGAAARRVRLGAPPARVEARTAVADTWDEDDERTGRIKGGRALVDCDRLCEAYQAPDLYNLAEVLAAFHHWYHHEWLGGCSHAR